jgi:hypothetical protein
MGKVTIVEGFKSSPGWRSAAMLLLLVLEGIAKSLGFEAGPLFFIVRSGFGVLGVSPTEATALNIDPEQLVVGLTSLWFALSRLWSVYKERRAIAAAKAAAELAAASADAAAATATAAALAPIALPPPPEAKE